MDNLQIKYRDLNDLKYLEMNFKSHALDEVENSLYEFGFVDPIGVNVKTGAVYDGNGRTKVLRDLYEKWTKDINSVRVPRGVTVEGNTWFVPVVEREFTELEEIKLAAVLNRANELGGYDDAKMLEVLQYLDAQGELEGSGFTDDDLQLLLAELDQNPPSLEDLKDKHGSADDLSDFDGEFKIKLSLPVYKRWMTFWDNLSGAPDERVDDIIDTCGTKLFMTGRRRRADISGNDE